MTRGGKGDRCHKTAELAGVLLQSVCDTAWLRYDFGFEQMAYRFAVRHLTAVAVSVNKSVGGSGHNRGLAHGAVEIVCAVFVVLIDTRVEGTPHFSSKFGDCTATDRMDDSAFAAEPKPFNLAIRVHDDDLREIGALQGTHTDLLDREGENDTRHARTVGKGVHGKRRSALRDGQVCGQFAGNIQIGTAVQGVCGVDRFGIRDTVGVPECGIAPLLKALCIYLLDTAGGFKRAGPGEDLAVKVNISEVGAAVKGILADIGIVELDNAQGDIVAECMGENAAGVKILKGRNGAFVHLPWGGAAFNVAVARDDQSAGGKIQRPGHFAEGAANDMRGLDGRVTR